ncbi:phosphoribosylformylglycinamidin [Phellopilus nigrolimitatus]|nr:phosphoribosylformylglycinamidin [Phellopilus nigrolimitatus]
MLVLAGSSALSPSKRKTVLAAIQNVCAYVDSVDAIYIHLVNCSSTESEEALSQKTSVQGNILDSLLDYGDDFAFKATRDAFERGAQNLVYVLPRAGSISPWSSKATDIARICNLGQHIERIERGIVYFIGTKDDRAITDDDLRSFSQLIHDRMTQVAQLAPPEEFSCFQHHVQKPLRTIDLQSRKDQALATLSAANRELGLALAGDEIRYLVDAYVSGENALDRNPTDAELFMFAQVNSEHCRHKIFNATWTIDGETKVMSLFQMIRNTEKLNGAHTISAYSDNAAVLEGYSAPRFSAHGGPDMRSGVYTACNEAMPVLIKVETHNHPTAVSPYPGAATGSGGEIRDEGAVGLGSKPKAGLSGFAVSNLLIPGYEQPWETDFGRPPHIASALDIILEAPLGASAFNNEFGRPALTGYFRTFAEKVPSSSNSKAKEIRGFHKPIMIAGGFGNVRPQFVKKTKVDAGARIVVLGGPGMLIGLGGGAASSQASGASSAELDFASVQRDNAEMQRRCQQVIDTCVDLGDNSPIQSIHDVGAGGLSNALPELVHDSDLGATFEIRDILVADTSMSPMEIWCNESQERYVLAITPSQAKQFEKICARERCPFSFVGVATEKEELIVTDRLLKEDIIRLKMSTLFGKPPRMSRYDTTPKILTHPFDASLSQYLPGLSSLEERLSAAVERVLRLPSVGSKSFLVTIGDRSITGLVARDQMVGPWQVPVADVAVTRTTYGFDTLTGEAMAMGERPPVALLNPAASARLAVAESLTNLVAASVESLSRVKLSANWMCAASKSGEGAGLYEAVQAIGMELCPSLGVGIPVGKDSMSMSMKWKNDEEQLEVTGPLSLNITAFAPVNNINKTWTPQLRTDLDEETTLVFFDLAAGKTRLGGSALAQVFKEIGSETPDVENASTLKSFFEGCQSARSSYPDIVLAYHDRSDGGLLTTLVEMCFAGHVGAEISLDAIPGSHQPLAALFNEELGAVLQVRRSDLDALMSLFVKTGFPTSSIHAIGSVNRVSDQTFRIMHNSAPIFTSERVDLQCIWAETSYRLQSLRDEPSGAKQEFELIKDSSHSGLFYDLTFTYEPTRNLSPRPKVAILREQGVNGHVEMAWAFSEAGFDAVDVHMSDVIGGSISLAEFRGIAACGGFSYGDVLGAGNGWANSILLNETAKREFQDFFQRKDVFALAVCNGCQFFSRLRHIIPGAESWPDFKPNKSERFEGRTSMVEIVNNEVTASSVFFRDMAGSKLPVAVAHGEGRVSFSDDVKRSTLIESKLIAVRYVDSDGVPTEVYPLNPNGSPGGITGVQTPDGRVLALMPHPERVVTLQSNSWYPPNMAQSWHQSGPWFRIFQNARKWCA